MKKQLKLLCLILTVVFTLALALSGCGTAKVNNTATTVKDATIAATTSPATTVVGADISKEVKLDWYYVGNKEETDNQLISDKMTQITKTKINATVQMHVFDWGSYQKKIDMMIGEIFRLNRALREPNSDV